MGNLEESLAMIFDPKKLSQKENYKLLISTILPRPIALISTISKKGVANLAPFSFFNGATSNPPTITVSIARKSPDGQCKDTINNIRETGEFTINMVSQTMAERMNESATEFPPEIDEFEISGFGKKPSQIVKPAIVEQSLVSYECKTYQILEIGKEEPGAGFLVIGEVLLFHVADHIWQNNHVSTDLLDPLARMAGQEYGKITERFKINRKLYRPES